MSAASSLLLKFLIIASSNLLLVCCGNVPPPSSSTHNNNNHHHHNNGQQDWQRNLETQLTRILTRMDQFELRLGRVQSLIQLRFDNIESGYTTTKLRMDVLSDGHTRIDEQLSRKWKILESKFDILLNNVDSKLETKLNAMQRDNRRHNEFLTQSFTSVVNSQEKLNDKVSALTKEVNSSLQVKAKQNITQLEQNSDKMLNILLQLVSNSSSSSSSQCHPSSPPIQPTHVDLYNQTLAQQLLGNKVTNMFEDLMRRSSSMETVLKDAVSLANVTRKDVHDGFRTLIASSMATSQSNNNQQRSRSLSNNNYNNNGGGSSSELMSAVIVEALASVDSMSTALGRKITEFSRSVDERLELVSMSINGFLESCTRIQDNQPMFEDYIGELLIRILNSVDNSTRSASELWFSVADQILEDRENMTKHWSGINTCLESQNNNHNNGATSHQQMGNEVLKEAEEGVQPSLLPIPQRYEEDISEDTEETTTFPEEEDLNRKRKPSRRLGQRRRADGQILTEEDKKELWESIKLSSEST